MEMFDYSFNKIFILKSLGEADTYADDLYSETIEPFCQKYGLATEPPIEIFNRSDWDKAIEIILQDDCRYPLIHFEMHGNEEKGLSLRLGDYVPWADVIKDLTRINVRSELNLIITMAVCYSTKLAFNISMAKQPAPYLFSVSTSKKIRGDATYRLFSVFFKELIETKELYTALKRVEKEDPELPKMFDILAVPFLFENAFKEYVLEHQKDESIEREFFHTIPVFQEREMTREEFGLLKNQFKNMYHRKVNEYYKKARDIFFMYDILPQNRQRFNLPEKII